MKKAFFLAALSLGAFSLSYAHSHKANGIVQMNDTTGRQPVDTSSYMTAGFPGGRAAWLKYLQKNIRYPSLAIMQKISGVVIIGFDVSETGKLSKIEVVHAVHPLLDNEALRLIKESPDWVPAIEGGKNVASHMEQRITFRTPQ